MIVFAPRFSLSRCEQQSAPLQLGGRSIRSQGQARPNENHNHISKGDAMNAQTNQNEREIATTIEIELNVEELEEVIAPRTIIGPQERNHNETLVHDAE